MERLTKTRFTAKDSDGAQYSWFFWFDKGRAAWYLGDYTGYERRLECDWRDSAPRIVGILENHGMTAQIS
jgi:hypothetical protein